MATNQVIKGKNRVIDGQAKFNITDNADGTKKIELANTITQEGTKISKSLLDKVDNVLSYLQPSVEKETISSKTVTKLNAESITPRWTSSKVIKDDLILTYEQYGENEAMELKFVPGESVKFYAYNDRVGGSYIGIWSYLNNAIKVDSNSFISNFNLRTSSSNYYNAFALDTRFYFDLIYDLKAIRKAKIKGVFLKNTNLSRRIEISNDGINWYTNEQMDDYNNNRAGQYILNCDLEARYVKIRITNTSVTDNITEIIHYLYLETEFDVIRYKNHFTLDNNGTEFTNNQRVLIETPNNEDMSLDNVTSNTINGVECDKILLPSIKYELIYNESDNKFNLGGAKVLFDITLTEAVKQVDLTGLSDMIQDDKIYALILYNNDTNSTGGVNFGYTPTKIMSLNVSAYGSNFALFIPQHWYNSNNVEFCGLHFISGGVYGEDTIKNRYGSYEILSITGNGLGIGTRIIIKEVC